MKVAEAIKFLKEERGTNTENLSEIKYRVYDEGYSFYVETDRDLISYAEEQKQEVEE